MGPKRRLDDLTSGFFRWAPGETLGQTKGTGLDQAGARPAEDTASPALAGAAGKGAAAASAGRTLKVQRAPVTRPSFTAAFGSHGSLDYCKFYAYYGGEHLKLSWSRRENSREQEAGVSFPVKLGICLLPALEVGENGGAWPPSRKPTSWRPQQTPWRVTCHDRRPASGNKGAWRLHGPESAVLLGEG